MKVLFVCSGNSKFGIAPLIKSQGHSLKQNGVEVEYFPIIGKGLIGYLKVVVPLKKYVKKNCFDLIHSHYALSGWISVLSSLKIPVVVSFMGCDVYGDVSEKGKFVFSSIINVFLAFLLQPFVKSIVVKSKNLQKFVFLKKKSNIIPNGVDFSIFKQIGKLESREHLKLRRNRKYVLFLGNPKDPRKNFKLLKRSINLFNDSDIEILNPYPVNHDKIVLYMNASDVLILTSFKEGSPNVIKEAMACNLPIVSTDVGDVRDVIGETEGCYISSFAPKDVAVAMKSALDFGQRTNGRERLKRLGLDHGSTAKRIILVYERVLKNR